MIILKTNKNFILSTRCFSTTSTNFRKTSVVNCISNTNTLTLKIDRSSNIHSQENINYDNLLEQTKYIRSDEGINNLLKYNEHNVYNYKTLFSNSITIKEIKIPPIKNNIPIEDIGNVLQYHLDNYNYIFINGTFNELMYYLIIMSKLFLVFIYFYFRAEGLIGFLIQSMYTVISYYHNLVSIYFMNLRRSKIISYLSTIINNSSKSNIKNILNNSNINNSKGIFKLKKTINLKSIYRKNKKINIKISYETKNISTFNNIWSRGGSLFLRGIIDIWSINGNTISFMNNTNNNSNLASSSIGSSSNQTANNSNINPNTNIINLAVEVNTPTHNQIVNFQHSAANQASINSINNTSFELGFWQRLAGIDGQYQPAYNNSIMFAMVRDFIGSRIDSRFWHISIPTTIGPNNISRITISGRTGDNNNTLIPKIYVWYTANHRISINALITSIANSVTNTNHAMYIPPVPNASTNLTTSVVLPNSLVPNSLLPNSNTTSWEILNFNGPSEFHVIAHGNNIGFFERYHNLEDTVYSINGLVPLTSEIHDYDADRLYGNMNRLFTQNYELTSDRRFHWTLTYPGNTFPPSSSHMRPGTSYTPRYLFIVTNENRHIIMSFFEYLYTNLPRVQWRR